VSTFEHHVQWRLCSDGGRPEEDAECEVSVSMRSLS